jgi:hypothetical protein
MAGGDKRDDQPQATKTKLDTIVSHLDAMKTLITGLQKEVDAGDLHGHARCASIRGGNDSFSTLPFTIPPYNSKYDPATYINWELEVEQKFSYHDIPAISQVQTAISEFTNLALFWWHHEYKQKHPTTWAELKASLRHRFVPSYYARNAERDVQGRRSKQYSNSFAGQSSTSSSAPALPAPSTPTTTVLESPTPFTPTTIPLGRTAEPAGASSDPSLQNAPNTPIENIGNVHVATLTEGENCVNMLNFFTNHTLVEQLIMEPSLDLSLSHGDLLDVSCYKAAWCATTSILHASAENKLFTHVSSRSHELHLFSSLHTLGYIEFDDLCKLDCLEERIFTHADLPWLSRHSYHVIGKYNNKGQYMVHRIYICTNLNSPFVVQDCD